VQRLQFKKALHAIQHILTSTFEGTALFHHSNFSKNNQNQHKTQHVFDQDKDIYCFQTKRNHRQSTSPALSPSVED